MHDISMAALPVFLMQSLAYLAPAPTRPAYRSPLGSAGPVYLRQTSKPSIARKWAAGPPLVFNAGGTPALAWNYHNLLILCPCI